VTPETANIVIIDFFKQICLKLELAVQVAKTAEARIEAGNSNCVSGGQSSEPVFRPQRPPQKLKLFGPQADQCPLLIHSGRLHVR
jgi:hypothetical protein